MSSQHPYSSQWDWIICNWEDIRWTAAMSATYRYIMVMAMAQEGTRPVSHFGTAHEFFVQLQESNEIIYELRKEMRQACYPGWEKDAWLKQC